MASGHRNSVVPPSAGCLANAVEPTRETGRLQPRRSPHSLGRLLCLPWPRRGQPPGQLAVGHHRKRSEEHTSELQSRGHLVCRLLLEKKKKKINIIQAQVYEVM